MASGCVTVCRLSFFPFTPARAPCTHGRRRYLLPMALLASDQPPTSKNPVVSSRVLDVIEKELSRLTKQGEQEEKRSPERPMPSAETAYLLLSGLATQGESILDPPTEERSQLGMEPDPPVMKQLVTVGPDARLVKTDVKIQDKSGSYRLLSWALYRKRDGKWSQCGSGQTSAVVPRSSDRYSSSSEERTWISTTENGCKPGIALVLIEKAGKATGGKFYILDPKHTRDLSKGLGYNFSNVRHEGKTITGDVSVIDGSTRQVHKKCT